MKLQLLHVAAAFAFITSMSLEARFLERKVSDELTVWDVEERICENQTQVPLACTILNLHCEDVDPMSIAGQLNADMVCIQGVASVENAYSICEALQENYAYFLYIDPTTKWKEKPSDGQPDKLVVASKYVFATDDTDRLIRDAINYIVDAYFLQEDADYLVLKHLKEEDTEKYTIVKHSVPMGEGEGVEAHVVKKSSYALRSSGYDNVLVYECSNNAPDIHLVRGGADRDGRGSSVTGEVTVKVGPGGPQWGGSVNGERHDGRGNSVKGKMEYDSKSKETELSLSGTHTEEDKDRNRRNDK